MLFLFSAFIFPCQAFKPLISTFTTCVDFLELSRNCALSQFRTSSPLLYLSMQIEQRSISTHLEQTNLWPDSIKESTRSPFAGTVMPSEYTIDRIHPRLADGQREKKVIVQPL